MTAARPPLAVCSAYRDKPVGAGGRAPRRRLYGRVFVPVCDSAHVAEYNGLRRAQIQARFPYERFLHWYYRVGRRWLGGAIRDHVRGTGS